MALVSLLLSATLASAQSHRLYPGIDAGYVGELAPRQLLDSISDCTISDTCGECFGLGYVLCDNGGCFNPDDGQQCCKGGSMCIGLNSSCCNNGPGKPGKDGVVPYSSDAPVEDDDEDEDSGSSIFCDTSMTGEECCSQGGDDIHWCSGEFPANTCFNSTELTCCVDGHVCAGEECCDIADSTPTAPWLSGTTTESTSTSTTTSGSDSDSDSETDTETVNESTTTPAPSSTTPSEESSPIPTDAGEKLAVVKGTSALLGALAVGLLVL
ncbi:hypothetical protein BDV12DRAFT_194023 [Aspergillus spectabilis]